MTRPAPQLAPLYALLLACGGASLPETLDTTRAAAWAAPPGTAWAVIGAYAGTDAAPVRAWRTDLAEVKPGPQLRGHATWEETDAEGQTLRWETVEVFEGRRLVRCVVPREQEAPPWGGCHTMEVAPRDGGSAVTITERARFPSAAYRWRHAPEERGERLEAGLRALGGPLGGAPLAVGTDLRDLRRALDPPKPAREAPGESP